MPEALLPGTLASARGDGAPVRPPLVALALHGAFWLALLAWVWRTPPIDNVEQLLWRGALEWGYYKHPPLPTWLLALASPAWPATPALTLLLGALCLLGALWMLWWLVRRLLGPGDALLSVLAVLCITYSTQRLAVFNHNVVMLPLVAGVALLLWRLTQRPRLANWAGIGLLLGLGLLTKYQTGVVAVCVAGWWLRIGGWRQPVHRRGALLAGALAGLLFLPHLVWLARADWAPLHYAATSSLGAHLPLAQRPVHVGLWVLDWLGNRLLPAWGFLALAGWLATRCAPRAPVAVPVPPSPLARDYLLLWGLGPLVVMALLGLLGGIRLQFKWSTAFALWTVPALLLLLPPRWRWPAGASPRAAWCAYGVVQALLVVQLLYTVQLRRGDPDAEGGWKQRDFGALAAALAAPARQALGGPVQVINGPYGVAGMLALKLPERPRVLIDGLPAHSPWIDPARLPGARTLSVWPACQLAPGAHWLAPGWAWWPRATPPDAASPREVALRQQASQSGGTAVVSCP